MATFVETPQTVTGVADGAVFPPTTEDNARTCAIIGPANSGKTTLLLSMQQACLQNDNGFGEQATGLHRYKLDFVPDNEPAVSLTTLAGEFLFHGNKVRATRDVTNYSFRIFANNLSKSEREYFSRLTVTDGPGGHLFPRERGSVHGSRQTWSDLIASTKDASSLVLCVDGSSPALEVLYEGVPKLILDLKAGARRLPYRRVLLLVTKIDRLVEQFFGAAQSFSKRRQASLGAGNPALEMFVANGASTLTAAQLARSLHPLEQTRQLFGRLIDMVQAGLDANATFVVGLCSALGFNARTGSAFVSRSRDVAPPSASSVASRFRDWEPYGVREALLFLIANEIRHPMFEVPKVTVGSAGKKQYVGVPLDV